MQSFKIRLFSLLTALFMMLSLSVAALPTAAFADEEISKILTTLSSKPVALLDPSLITVATSTPGCYIISAGWLDSSGNVVSGNFSAETYRLVINIGANDGYSIDQNVACYLNNSAVNCAVDPSGNSVTITREFTAEIWAPTVYKNPGAETVNEGGWASFVVSGSYVTGYEWAVVDPSERSSIPVSQLKDTYRGMEVAGDGTTKLMLYHIPYELNGWKVVCDFIGAGVGNVTRSQPALLTVIPDPSRVIETPEPSVEVSPTPTVPPESSVIPDVSPEPEVHEHHYSDTWNYDVRGHWRTCPNDGAVTDEGLHSFVWTEIQPSSDSGAGLEQGICSVCGYVSNRGFGGPDESSTDEDNDQSASLFSFSDATPPTVLMLLLSTLLPVNLVLIGIHLCGPAKQRRRKRRR